MITITHKFFPLGATMHRLKDNTVAFIYPNEDSLQLWCSWYTGDDMKDKEINIFLDECCTGEHSTLGSGWADTWINIMLQLEDFSK